MTKSELYHHGVKGQKWGIRNYQNEDGSYKPGAEGRYDQESGRERYLKEGRGPAAKRYGSNTLVKDSNSYNRVKVERANAYSNRDHDWDEKNYSEKNRVSGTNFHMFTKPDGSIVILEENMKWTVPAGAATPSQMAAAIKKFNNDIKDVRETGDWTSETWEKMVNEYMNQAIRDANKNDKKKVPKPGVAKQAVAQSMRHSDSLYHHGILGQKWGIRRFQNPDGTYTTEGKRRRRSDSYSDDHKRYVANKRKSIEQLSTKEIEELNRRDSAIYNYNRNHKVGKDWFNKLGSKVLDKSAEAVAVWFVYKVGKNFVKRITG